MKINNETKVGMMVLIVIVLLIGLTVKTGNFNFSKENYIVKVRFKSINGVGINSPVMLNGYEVGLVEAIDIVDDGEALIMELTLELDRKAKIRDGVEARVKNLGFMGEKYVGLKSGDNPGDYIKAGAFIVGKEAVDLDEILVEGKEIAKQLKGITTNLNERLEVNRQKIDQIVANLNSTLENTDSITENVDLIISGNQVKINEAIANLHILSVNLEEMSYDLKVNPWKLLYRKKERKTE